jgi:ribosomal protein L11 methyltransferase
VGEKYIEVSVAGTGETEEALADFLFGEGALGLVTEDLPEEPGRVLIRASFPRTLSVERIVARLVNYQQELAALGLAGAEGPIGLREIPAEDWGRSWKDHFKPLAVGRHLLVAPSWEAGPFQEDRIVIRIDPGMGFGTGHHATTRMCLEALEAFTEQWSGTWEPEVLDVGTGTGILAIAAAALGARRVVALDTDPEACSTATRNLVHNRATDRVHLLQGGIAAISPDMCFDVVLANLDTKSLCSVLNTLKGLVAPQGRLVASGILVEEEETVSGAARVAGFRVLTRKSDGEWLCLTLAPEAGDNRSAPASS